MDNEYHLLEILLNPAQWSSHLDFQSSWGIRQGDLISPFMFILMAEGLGWVIKSMVDEDEIKGLILHTGEDKQTH